MTTPTSCPSQSTLSAFSVGNVPELEFERVAAHLGVCPQCACALMELEDHTDELVANLRGLPADVAGETSSIPAAILRCAHDAVRSDEEPSCNVPIDAGKHYSRLLSKGACRLGRFELLEELGSGAFGYVFRAYDTELDRTVAVKIQRVGSVATDEEARRFLREARSAVPLTHPSVVSLYETGQTEDGVCFLVTEFVEGQTLEERLRRERFHHRDTAELIAQLADALDYAHRHSVIHRDVKPSNVLIDGEGRPHITDFGLAKREALDASMTSDGRIMGTPAYMSPEHARGDAHHADARSDVYSLGVILYEMLTGERPFQGTKRLLLLQVLEDEPRSPRQLDDTIPRDLEIICQKAMAKSPPRRYQSAGAFAADLRRYLSGDPIQARAIGYAERLWHWCRRYPLAAALFIGVSLGSIAGFIYVRHLNTWFVQEMALDNARLYSDMLEEFNASYSDVRSQFFGHGEGTEKIPPPLPATLQIEMAERINRRETGMLVRIFSPFSFRKELRPRDGFENETLSALRRQVHQPTSDGDKALEHFEFVTLDGRPYLKYARGQIMKESCVQCHNTHKDTPKRDWKEGDLAGVLTLTRPLDRDVARTRSGFRGASILMLTIATVLTACGLFSAYRTRRTSRG